MTQMREKEGKERRRRRRRREKSVPFTLQTIKLMQENSDIPLSPPPQSDR